MIWHVDIDTSNRALERFARALLSTGASLLPSRVVMGEMGRGTTACLVVEIPDGQEDRFDAVCAPQVRKNPPKMYRDWEASLESMREVSDVARGKP